MRAFHSLGMRPLAAVLILTTAAVDCKDHGPTIDQAFELFAVNGTSLPVVTAGVSIVSGTFELWTDNRFTQSAVLVATGGSSQIVTESGTWQASQADPKTLALTTTAGAEWQATKSNDLLEVRELPIGQGQVRLYLRRP